MSGMNQDNLYPQGTTPFENQVAGHAFNDSKPRIGLLVNNESGCVLKPIEGPVRGQREVNFYKELQSNQDQVCKQLKSFVPQFFGTQKVPWNGEEVDYIVLSNATAGMVKPCVMDIKIGRISWDPEAPASKKEKELKKYAECKAAYGFCIPGFQFYNPCSGQLTRLGKEFGKLLNKNTTEDALRMFLNLESGGHSVLKPFISKLREIVAWCETQRHFLLYSSSVLLAYDADQLLTSQSPKCSVTLIDFAHVFPSDGQLDTNYLHGITSLVNLLESFLLET